jgi:hypothetical protein
LSVRVLIALLIAGALVGALVELSCLAGETRGTSVTTSSDASPGLLPETGVPNAPEVETYEAPASGPTITY